MSYQAVQAVRDYSRVTDNQGRIIMLIIASYCNEHGNMDNAVHTPTYKTLADGAACHPQTIKNWLDRLEKTGELSYRTEKIEGTVKKRVRFTINLPMSNTSLPFEDESQPNDRQTRLDILDRMDKLEQKIDSIVNALAGDENSDMSTTRVQHEYIHSCTHKDNKDNKEGDTKQTSEVGQLDNEQVTQQAIPLSLDNNEQQQDTNNSKDEAQEERELSPIEIANQYTHEQLKEMPFDQKHPVSLVWINANKRRIPNRLIKNVIKNILDIGTFNGEVLKYVCELWDLAGYKPTNYNGKIEWYKDATKSIEPLKWSPYSKSQSQVNPQQPAAVDAYGFPIGKSESYLV